MSESEQTVVAELVKRLEAVESQAAKDRADLKFHKRKLAEQTALLVRLRGAVGATQDLALDSRVWHHTTRNMVANTRALVEALVRDRFGITGRTPEFDALARRFFEATEEKFEDDLSVCRGRLVRDLRRAAAEKNRNGSED